MGPQVVGKGVAQIPVDEKLLSAYKTQKQAITAANAPQDLPFRGMPSEAKLNDHYKEAAELAAEATRVLDRVLSPASKIKLPASTWTPSSSKQLALTDAQASMVRRPSPSPSPSLSPRLTRWPSP